MLKRIFICDLITSDGKISLEVPESSLFEILSINEGLSVLIKSTEEIRLLDYGK